MPVIVNGECIAEIDLDSPFKNRFTADEQKEMEEAAADIAAAFIAKGWKLD